jgi:hypothetical protein
LDQTQSNEQSEPGRNDVPPCAGRGPWKPCGVFDGEQLDLRFGEAGLEEEVAGLALEGGCAVEWQIRWPGSDHEPEPLEGLDNCVVEDFRPGAEEVLESVGVEIHRPCSPRWVRKRVWAGTHDGDVSAAPHRIRRGRLNAHTVMPLVADEWKDPIEDVCDDEAVGCSSLGRLQRPFPASKGRRSGSQVTSTSTVLPRDTDRAP